MMQPHPLIKRLTTGLLLAMLLSIPFGVSHAQDYAALSKLLKKAVKKGEITEEQAWKNWQEFKEQQLAPKLKASVESGHLDGQRARAFWRGVEKAEDEAKAKRDAGR